MKSVAVQDAIYFVKKQAKDLTKYLTKEHTQLVEQFQNYKHRTRKLLQERDDFKMALIDAELFAAQRYPACEAHYAFEDQNALGLYDCLTPCLKEHRRIHYDLYPYKYAEDMKMQLEKKQHEAYVVG